MTPSLNADIQPNAHDTFLERPEPSMLRAKDWSQKTKGFKRDSRKGHTTRVIQ
jgi:hypothetical protein